MSFSNFYAVLISLTYSVWDISYSIDKRNWMNLNSREICGLNIKPFLIDVAFCYLGGDRLYALIFRPSVSSVA